MTCIFAPYFYQISHKNLSILSIKRVNLYLNSGDAFRRIRTEQVITSPPGVRGEALLRNLYALFIRFPNLTSEDLTSIFPTLSSISGSNIADHKLSKSELEELLKSVPKISETQIRFNYSMYSDRYDSSIAGDALGNFLDLFEQYLFYVLNSSGTMEPVFKLVQYLAAAEPIALETQHLLGSSEEGSETSRNEQAIEWHRLFFASESDMGRYEDTTQKYFQGKKLSLQDREFAMASVYIILGNYILLKDSRAERVERNISILLYALAQDLTTRDSISRVKNIIETMPLKQDVKDKTLSLFPPREEPSTP